MTNESTSGDGNPSNENIFTHTTLPPEGYIQFTDFEDTPNLRNIHRHEYKSTHSKFTTRKPDEIYMERLEEIADRCNTNTTREGFESTDMIWHGDAPVYDEKWPKQSSQFRVHQLNVNGLPFKDDHFLIDLYLQGITTLQSDIQMAQELNLNLTNPEVRQRFLRAMRRYDRLATIELGYVHNQEYDKSEYRPGGVMTWTHGIHSGRVEKRESDKYGRWSNITMLRRNNQKIAFISGYKVCKGTKLDGTGIASQQFRAMQKDKRVAKNQRKEFDEDLKQYIGYHYQSGQEVCLAMDANTWTTAEEMNTFLVDTGMVNVYDILYPNKDHPRTFFRGKGCIDGFFITPGLQPMILRMGYAPFYAMGPYDHRFAYLDFDRKTLFTHKVDVTRSAGRGLSLTNRKMITRYIATLKKLIAKSKLKEKIEKAVKRLSETDSKSHEHKHYIGQLQKYKIVINELMLAAERKSLKKYPQYHKWSIVFKTQGTIMRYWNKRLDMSKEGDHEGASLKKPPKYNPAITTTHDEVTTQHAAQTIEWIKVKDSSGELYRNYMEELTEYVSETRNTTTKGARKMLYHQEEMKARHKKQGYQMKDKRTGMLSEILFPQPNDINPTAHMKVKDEKHIETILLRRNAGKLIEANISPFSTGSLAKLLDENGRCDVSTSLINGTFDYERIDAMEDIKHKEELKMILKALKKKEGPDGSPLPTVASTITKEDFQGMFKVKSAETSCGPSGLSMPHWKAAAEDDLLSEIHSMLITAPFQYGFSYEAWEVSLHCMLLKDKLPYWLRLRIIQLFEADFNVALNLIFGRRQMYFRDKYGLNTEATYGGRKHKSCHQALTRIQYTAEHSRLTRIPIALVDVDAAGCFDRIVGLLNSLIGQSNGLTQATASCQAEVLHKMKHYVKTKRGVSHNYIQRSETLLLEGNGQGNAGSVPGWHGHNELLCEVYSALIEGCEIQNPDRTIDFIQWLLSFVDDNKMLTSYPHNVTHETIMGRCKKSLQLWEILLNITGGALELKKCLLTILVYSFEKSFQKVQGWQYKPGYPHILNNSQILGECKVYREEEAAEVTIKRQEASKGTRLLGVRAAADGNFKDEYKYRLDQSRKLAGRLQNAPGDHRDAWMIYFCRYKPAIGYCLPITTFTDIECDTIQSPFYQALLPKLGFNRHTAQVILFGPRRYGGMQMMDMKVEQLAKHVHNLITHIRRNDRVGKTIRACLDTYQVIIGRKQHFLTLNAYSHDYRPPRSESVITYIWEGLSQIGFTLHGPSLWTQPHQYENDSALMEDMIIERERRRGTVSAFKPYDLWGVNACRLYLGVSMLSEITDETGQSIALWAMYGHRRNETIAITFPHQPKPPALIWKTWRDCLHSTYVGSGRTRETIPLHWTREIMRPVTTIKAWHERIARGQKLEEVIALLPCHLREAVGHIKYPTDNGAQLILEMNRQEVHAWSDGTVKDVKGAHAFILCPMNDDANTIIVGTEMTPADPVSLTSLRTEHYGALGVAVLVTCLIHIHGVTIPLQSMTHHIDSTTVRDRLNKRQNTLMMSDKELSGTDYDVWAETDNLLKNPLLTIRYEHVKGHQADTLEKKYKVRGPLPRVAHYNEVCDTIAGETRMKYEQPYHLHMFPSSKIALHNGQTFITASAYTSIIDNITGTHLAEYVQDQNKWPDHVFQTVNWEAIERYMKGMPVSKQVKICKYMHNWQNTGRQKQKFAQSAGLDTEDEENKKQYVCPFGCGRVEHNQHYLRCRRSPKYNHKLMCLKSIKDWMVKNNTSKLMRIVIQMRMADWINGDRMPRINVREEEGGMRVQKAVDEQDEIGWDQFFKGRLSKEWQLIQDEEYQRLSNQGEKVLKHQTGLWWTARLIRLIIYFALNEWQVRNDTLHETKDKTAREATRNRLKMIATKMYDIHEQADHPVLRRYFKRPYLETITKPTTRLEHWLVAVITLYEEEAKTEGSIRKLMDENGVTIEEIHHTNQVEE